MAYEKNPTWQPGVAGGTKVTAAKLNHIEDGIEAAAQAADLALAQSGAADATTTSKGIVQLAGDLAGTATAPTVPGLASKVETTDPRLSDARTPTAHTHPASQISDSTATGRSVITATDAAAARTAIGAGTSSFSGAYADLTGKPTLGDAAAKNTGTTAGTVAAGDHTHAAGDVTSGTFAVAHLGTGTPAAGKYVDGGTGAWTTLPAGGGGTADGPPPGVSGPPVTWWVAPFNLTGTKTGKTISTLRPSYTVLSGQITVDQVGIQVTAAEAAKNAKLLIYSSTADGLPNTLVINSGPMSLGATGNVTASITPTVLPPGTYWGFIVTDGTTATIEVASQDVRQSVADTFNRVRNTLNEWWSASPGTYASPAATISSFTWSSYGAGLNVAPIWAMRRSA